MTSKAQSRVERSKENSNKKVKVVIDTKFQKIFKYAWFPTTAFLLFIIGLQIGVYYITLDSTTGNYQTIFDKGMWSSFWDAIKNF
ncbi:hypothetical protein HYG86_01100 [Alkalicella caledoniensis]|uniref:Uncharacterized protein n=1 Tax=Alkalicella caledoniensis TaxID=2731377 RepID=A0A7G9W456_ALKCA|nr:hypothetical protein [Alkalicella caledoniensis]QNO13468.1 hypothetical protein HYG86_01100 [Alkalicella caledoniensis]